MKTTTTQIWNQHLKPHITWLVCGLYLLAQAAPLAAQTPQTAKAETTRYEVAEIYIIGLDKLEEAYIQRYLSENGIKLGTQLSQKKLERKAVILREIAKQDPALLSLDLFFNYDEEPIVKSVSIEVAVSEMSLSFLPGGGDAYATFAWINRIPRKGQPSVLELAAGYNRQDLSLDLPHLDGGSFGLDFGAGHQILDQWDFGKTSRIRSNAFLKAGAYWQPWTWLKIGGRFQLGLLYFYQAPEEFSTSRALELLDEQSLGLGAELEQQGLGNKLHGTLSLEAYFSLDRKYLAKQGLGYHLTIGGHYDLLGLFAAQQGFFAAVGLVSEPLTWYRSSLELRGAWQTTGMLPLDSEVFSSKEEGYIRGAAELRNLFIPIHIKGALPVDIGLNVGGILGFASNTDTDIDLARDLELSIFAGPEIVFGLPINIRTQLDFGIILSEQFTQVDFAFHIRVF